jgi:DNA topoisomerase VI subunit B
VAEKRTFLAPDTEQIKHQIKAVLESYSHDWDVLAELAQNSVDAVVRANPTRGHIMLTIDSVNKIVEVRDNGTGIDPSQLQRLLRPFGSDKTALSNQIGRKGVGLTFVLFSTTSFEIETHSSTGSASAKILGAQAWLDSNDNADLFVEISDIDPGTNGTAIRARIADGDAAIFRPLLRSEWVGSIMG